MAKARLLQAVCAVAMLAAAPALAQTDRSPASPGAGNSGGVPATDNAPATGGTASTSSTMTPADNMGSSSGGNSSASMEGQSTHRSAMARHSSGTMHARSDTSQNAAVDQLNNESYQAAQQGQPFSGSSMGSSGMTAPSGMTPGTAGSSVGR